MKKIILGVFLISSLTFSQTDFKNQTIEEILKLPEEQINLSIASLVLSKDFYPNMNVNTFLYVIGYMADQYKYYYGDYTDPEKRIRAMNTYLYRRGYWNDSLAFSYNDDDLEAKELNSKFINGYLSTKKGSCITMPMLHILLGERLGYPIYAVRSPKHFFARYIEPGGKGKFRANIEATSGGGYFSDKQYKEDVLIPDKAIKNGVYLRTLTKKEYIASLLTVNANEWTDRKDWEKAKHYLELAIQYDSTLSTAHWNYGIIAFWEARQLEEELRDKKQLLAGSYIQPEPSVKVSQPSLGEYNPFKQEPVISSKRNNFDINSSMTPKIPSVDIPELNLQNQNIGQTADVKRNNERIIREAKLSAEISMLEKRYEKLILAKLQISLAYKKKANDLGIVHEFPLQFFQRQADSIRRFKKNGGY